jgi:geranylgeranyl diphosphate synthase type II
MHTPEELRALVEDELERIELWPQLHGQSESARYGLVEMGGKRIRPVIMLAVGEALGTEPAQVMPAAIALEMVHNFSLIHDDLPALDNDAERRGMESVWARYGEGKAILAGDALLAEALRLSCSYPTPDVARELAEATLGMIGGQYLDTMEPGTDLEAVHRLKTGCLFYASVTLALWACGVPLEQQAAWRAFADELGMLFQVVDDILDSDGYVITEGVDAARERANRAAESALAHLLEIPDDTTVLAEIVNGLAVRTA